ncbi:MAG: hypothetical protein ACRD1P_10660 [Thermoanaerobaculia bacterium]
MPSGTGEDAASIDGIIRAIYEVISGPAGAPRDWERERKLFIPGGRLIPTRPRPEGGAIADVFDLEGYIGSRSPMFEKDSFFETEVARRTFRFGHIAHVLSAYELRRSPGEKPFMRGINSLQLFHDGSRWWILSIAWDNERPGNPLPDLQA